MRQIRVALFLGLSLVLLLGLPSLFSPDTMRAQAGITVQTNDVLRLRAGPGRNFDTLAEIPPGVTLTAYARSEDGAWVKVDYNGQPGWLAVRYLSIEGSLRSLPVGDAAPIVPPSGSGNPAAPPPGPTPQPKNGDLLSMTMYAQTDAINYYRITYYSDGLRINGFLSEPREPGKYPALIYNRGGNRDVGALAGWEFIPFSEAKFVVVASQYRGGGGSEGIDNLGGADVNDVLNLIPLLKSREQVDPSRIVMFGTSRGGMMTYIALKKLGGRDIRAAATASGLADLIMWAQERPDLNDGAYPELVGATTTGNPRAFRDRSATYWPGSIRVPLLIIHGDKDDVVSVEQSRTLYNKMRAAGASARLMIVFGADHGLSYFDGGAPYAIPFFGQYIRRGDENYDFDFYKPAIEKAYAIIRGR